MSKRAETGCPWCCQGIPILNQPQIPRNVCVNCRELYEYEHGETPEDKLTRGFRLLKGDCDAKNDIAFVAVTHELTDRK
jgi:hypothetical protein